MMKTFVKISIILMVLLGVIYNAVSQIVITVSTDKPTYQIGENIHISITACNLNDSTLTLYFSSACQSEYYIDDFYSGSERICAAILTSVSIPPDSSYIWNTIHFPDFHPVQEGFHAIIGEVIGYGLSDTIEISVKQNTHIKNRNMPTTYQLSQNHPNPFNSSTTILYSISSNDFVSLKVYDLLANEIRTIINEYQQKGKHTIYFDSASLSSGIYFYQLKVGKHLSEMRKMILLK